MSDLRPGVEHHLAGIAVAVERMAGWAGAAGPDAPVPTCPGWTVTDLVVHQGAVHRWATAMLIGGDPRAVDIDTFEVGGLEAPDPVAWLREGADVLLATLRAAPDELEAFTFLREAPPPRLFWARRQHHETTVHALDALAALENRTPSAADAWFDAATALDGVDELVVGFWPRRGKGPRAEGDPYPAVVAADGGERWLLEVGTDAVATRRLAAGTPAPVGAVELTGTAVDLYLALWNRGGRPHDPAGLLPRWSGPGRIV